MLLRLEIFIFLFTFLYILYFFSDTTLEYYKKRKLNQEEKSQRRKLREQQHKNHTWKKDINIEDIKKVTRDKCYISPEQWEQIREISKRAQINISRGYLESAQSLIIEGLALKKDDKDLNLLLADIYEREKKYQNAEYIYRDLLDEYNEDEYILQRLWNVYALRWKNDRALDCYENALRSNRSNTEVLDILAHLALELKHYKKALKYSNQYLKEKPRNAEKLGIKWFALEKLWKSNEAIKYYREVLQLQPYNTEIQDRIKNLEK
jgi:tetratricopeptide (TPR) repeat protein